MGRYDRLWGRGYDRGYGRDFGYRPGHPYRGPADFRGPAGRPPTPRGWNVGPAWARRYDARDFGGYDAPYAYGAYDASPTFGGYPGSPARGLYYGGGYDRFAGRGRPGGYDRPAGYAERGYGDDFARGPFLPERAYREHPELDHPHREARGPWPDRWPDDQDEALDDDEVRQRVEQNLHQDDWVDAARIEVEVHESVVTLRGDVDDYLEARYAWDDAWETTGVRGVLNQLTVRTSGGTHGDPFPQDERPTAGEPRGG